MRYLVIRTIKPDQVKLVPVALPETAPGANPTPISIPGTPLIPTPGVNPVP